MALEAGITTTTTLCDTRSNELHFVWHPLPLHALLHPPTQHTALCRRRVRFSQCTLKPLPGPLGKLKQLNCDVLSLRGDQGGKKPKDESKPRGKRG